MTAPGRAARLPESPEQGPLVVGGRHGTFLAFPSDAYLGEALLKYGEYGEAEFQFLREIWDALPSPRGCIVEVGANAGYLTVPLMTLADVVAFEPQPPVFELLKKHVVQNGVPGLEVQVFNLAVSDAPGSVPCPVVPFSAERCNHGGISMGVARDYDNIEVPCVTLDQKIAKPVSLIKVDVEGMEEQVLRGAQAIIARDRPVLYCENDRPEKSRSLIRFLWSLGYQCWFHLPPLFNPDNFFGVKENLWPGTVSVNMLCLPEGREPSAELAKRHKLVFIASERQLP